jgi:hypothetical protein
MDGLSGSVDGLAGLSMDFFYFFIRLTVAGRQPSRKIVHLP